ncbi:MAG TPA: DMT family transporter [Candidatus Cryptobacteroides merdipullorum]|uniref:DMT family transporter n=1 Tax=Candidatus Cryptobacteroides merdipullorum TaxID=2840771 RepID=A0A9D1GNP8_9BACT|nr:DMT family transporter [Candidatus Cryptobacteroides merdipullorum]
MWIWLTLFSAILLGSYDIVKKQAVRNNSVLWVLFGATALSTLFLTPFFSPGPFEDHLRLMAKAVLVSSSWISGLIAIKLLPLTTVSTIKASRPMFVVIFSLIIFQERLNLMQWGGVLLVTAALFMLGRSSKKEGITFTSNKGLVWMVVSVLTGVASALYDKHILGIMEPLFVQSWTNLYISVILALILLVERLRDRQGFRKFRWDWKLLVIAVLITGSDMLYFFAVNQEDALLSIISMIRRCSVLITFIGGAIIFRENNIRDKAIDLAILLGGLTLLLFGS